MKIENLAIRKVIDSRGKYTVEVEVHSASGSGRFISPSGASKGAFEAKDYPNDKIDEGIRTFRSVVSPSLKGKQFANIAELDAELHRIDGTPNLSKIGGNIAIATSLAALNAFAAEKKVPLYEFLLEGKKPTFPKPVSNIIGGGKHAVGGTTIQEFLSVAFGNTFMESISANIMVHQKVREVLMKKFSNIPIGLGDEKAWVAPVSDTEGMKILAEATKEVSKQTGIKVLNAVDVAASSFYEDGKYVYRDRSLSKEQQMEFISGLSNDYGLHLIEDPLDENDYEGYAELTKSLKGKSMIVGDDLFVTNKARLEEGIKAGAGNGIIIKPNQIGTFSDMLDTVKLAKSKGYATIISHRSGDTEDSTLAHLAVGLGIDYIKSGTIGGERTAKYNELIRIEERVRGQT